MFLIATIYFFVILLFFYGWLKLKKHTVNSENFTRLSLIIPFKNEEKNLYGLLKALSEQTLDKNYYEIIFVDDFSEDKSVEILKNFIRNQKNLFLIQNTGKGKKSALISGVKFSHYDFVVTTDADCIPEKKWLETISLAAENTDMLLMPVFLTVPTDINKNKNILKTLFYKMQELEFVSLQASTAGATSCGCPIMANAANMAFRKKFLTETKDVLNRKFESGDDVFLLHYIKKKGEVRFLKDKNAIVRTYAQENPKKFLRQRIRWTSKSKGYRDFFTLLTAFTVWGMNVALLLSIIYEVIFSNANYYLILLIIKSTPDFILLYSFTKKYKMTNLLKYFLPLQIIYPLYVVYVSIAGVFSKPLWKD